MNQLDGWRESGTNPRTWFYAPGEYVRQWAGQTTGNGGGELRRGRESGQRYDAHLARGTNGGRGSA